MIFMRGDRWVLDAGWVIDIYGIRHIGSEDGRKNEKNSNYEESKETERKNKEKREKEERNIAVVQGTSEN